jgi:hypothetical protein
MKKSNIILFLIVFTFNNGIFAGIRRECYIQQKLYQEAIKKRQIDKNRKKYAYQNQNTITYYRKTCYKKKTF